MQDVCMLSRNRIDGGVTSSFEKMWKAEQSGLLGATNPSSSIRTLDASFTHSAGTGEWRGELEEDARSRCAWTVRIVVERRLAGRETK